MGQRKVRVVQGGRPRPCRKRPGWTPDSALTLSMSACEVVGGIFRVGMWAGVVMVLLVVLAIWGILRLLS